MTPPTDTRARPWTASVTIDVPFHDVDAMEVVWHGHYFKYFERARTELFRAIGYDIPDMVASGYSWPIIDCQCRFPYPVRYGMKINVVATLLEYENRVRVGYEILDAESGKRLSKGQTTQVAFDMARQQMCLETPKVLIDLLERKR